MAIGQQIGITEIRSGKRRWLSDRPVDQEATAMTRKMRIRTAIAGIIGYCLFALIFASLMSARDIALVVLGLIEISISVTYLTRNRPLARAELMGELIFSGIILIAIAFVSLEYMVR